MQSYSINKIDPAPAKKKKRPAKSTAIGRALWCRFGHGKPSGCLSEAGLQVVFVLALKSMDSLCGKMVEQILLFSYMFLLPMGGTQIFRFCEIEIR